MGTSLVKLESVGELYSMTHVALHRMPESYHWLVQVLYHTYNVYSVWSTFKIKIRDYFRKETQGSRDGYSSDRTDAGSPTQGDILFLRGLICI